MASCHLGSTNGAGSKNGAESFFQWPPSRANRGGEIYYCKLSDCENYLHVYIFLISVHLSHLTLQHQTNLQLQDLVIGTALKSYPRRQHMSSQPSAPDDVMLHSRPLVPTEPICIFVLQKLGDFSKYIKS